MSAAAAITMTPRLAAESKLQAAQAKVSAAKEIEEKTHLEAVLVEYEYQALSKMTTCAYELLKEAEEKLKLEIEHPVRPGYPPHPQHALRVDLAKARYEKALNELRAARVKSEKATAKAVKAEDARIALEDKLRAAEDKLLLTR